MKIKEGYVLRQVADNWIVLPVGQASVDFNGMVNLNGSGVLLWRALEKGCDLKALADVLLSEYDVDSSTALSDAEEFVSVLRKAGCIEE